MLRFVQSTAFSVISEIMSTGTARARTDVRHEELHPDLEFGVRCPAHDKLFLCLEINLRKIVMSAKSCYV